MCFPPSEILRFWHFDIFKKKCSILLFYKKKSFNFAPVLS